MMRQYELVERVTSYDPDANEAMLNKAYVYAMKAHGHQVRASGDPYFTHPLEVAAILTEMKLDDATIAAALLHDVVEDTEATLAEIEQLFGGEISELVEGLTKIKRLDLISKEAAQAENLRKLLLAMSRDARVLLVKLADRLHNMRTLHHVKPEKRARIAKETMDIYAPLAGRMGMHSMREELDDIAFKALYPEARDGIMKRLEALRAESGDILTNIEERLTEQLAANGIGAHVSGREKKAYSIWRKMQRKHLSLGQLSDIFGFRIIVASEADCYKALGVAHTAWRVVPGRFKDYISNPKQNDYRSIHTTVIGPHRKRVELQIRTQAMDDIAERGVAAHSFYKDAADPMAAERGIRLPHGDSNSFRWLRSLVETLAEGDNPGEFLESTRLELFADQVFCFTPKGALIALPKGANAIDFAYAVHTDIGNSCVGCRINGRHAPLMTELANGDEVEVIRSQAQTPPAAWEKVVHTGKARSAIRRATRFAVRAQYAGLGREIIERHLARFDATYNKKQFGEAMRKLGVSSAEDGLAAVGRGELAAHDVMNALGFEGEREAPKRDIRKSRTVKQEGGVPSIPVRGVNQNLPLNIDASTGAVPGERIVGILKPGEGITVYPIFSAALQKFDDEPDLWIDLAWDEDSATSLYPARLRVVVHNEVGALGQLTQTVADGGANIENLQMTERARDFYNIDLTVEVEDVRHLNQIMNELARKPLISTVVRATGSD
ncbi:MAG: bifunctional (p)ppGpp synthetase/guanosine-3',5'-bis(diphosphate) 3'-pyrophosphohydrolase [Anderseniella sp.]|nr:bifunctional (p)ppGpp synthetase/guanosine-3',5'-bis(diphosphate) 3'-pyrophosphohydrolase [Anderseniella sp.]